MADGAARPRSRPGAALCAALRDGELALQVCTQCRVTQYPPAEVCRRCLGDVFDATPRDVSAVVVASAAVHRSFAGDFADGGPWPVASVRLDDGAVAFVHVADALAAGTRVRLVPLTDRLGDGVLGAVRDENDVSTLNARFACHDEI